RIGSIDLPVLRPQDAIAYAALHLLRHLLRGTPKPFHVYELARCLHFQASDVSFNLHSPELRRLEAVAFQLAVSWFGCDVSAEVREEIVRLPAATLSWFDVFVASPATAAFLPNKDELWLHLSLLDSTRD